MSKKKTKEEFVKEGQEKHKDENGEPLYLYDRVVYVNSKTPVEIGCKKCGEYFPQKPELHLRKSRPCGCPYCAGKYKTTEKFIKDSEEIHKDENGKPLYGYDRVVYINANTPVEIYCNECKKYFPQTPSHHLQGNGCPECAIKKNADKLRKSLEQFIKEGEEKYHDENGEPLYLYDRAVYIDYNTPLLIGCKKCGEYFPQSPGHHLNGQGCPYCSKKKKSEKLRKSLEQFIKESEEIHKDENGEPLYLYDRAVYIDARTPLLIGCKKCGEYFPQSPDNHLHGQGCPHCKESQGEKKIRFWLENNNFKKFEDYIPQFREKWLETLTLDFYLPELKIGIEYDGRQHFEPVKWNYKMTDEEAQKMFEDVQQRDKKKDLLCEQNNIRLIRIPYTDFDNIENILQEAI